MSATPVTNPISRSPVSKRPRKADRQDECLQCVLSINLSSLIVETVHKDRTFGMLGLLNRPTNLDRHRCLHIRPVACNQSAFGDYIIDHRSSPAGDSSGYSRVGADHWLFQPV